MSTLKMYSYLIEVDKEPVKRFVVTFIVYMGSAGLLEDIVYQRTCRISHSDHPHDTPT